VSGFLLDTNIPSEFRNPRPAPQVVQWLDSIAEDSVFISVVTLGEIRKGCELLENGKRREGLELWLEVEVRAWFQDRILPVTESIAERWGRLEAKRRRASASRSIQQTDRSPRPPWNMASRSLRATLMTSVTLA